MRNVQGRDEAGFVQQGERHEDHLGAQHVRIVPQDVGDEASVDDHLSGHVEQACGYLIEELIDSVFLIDKSFVTKPKSLTQIDREQEDAGLDLSDLFGHYRKCGLVSK